MNDGLPLFDLEKYRQKYRQKEMCPLRCAFDTVLDARSDGAFAARLMERKAHRWLLAGRAARQRQSRVAQPGRPREGIPLTRMAMRKYGKRCHSSWANWLQC